MMRVRVSLGLGLALMLAHGCYEDHGRGGPRDAAVEPSDGSADGGPRTDPCTTRCEAPSVLARLPIDLSRGKIPAVLDAVVHRDELVIALLTGFGSADGPDPEADFAVARISRRTGEARIEVIEVITTTDSIGAAALVSRGETLTLVAAYARREVWSLQQPMVLIASWEGAASEPRIRREPLSEESFEPCTGCLRRGASVAVGDGDALVALGGDGELLLGRVSLDGGAVRRETLRLPSAVASSALDARSDRAGSAVLAVGGLREGGTGTPTPAFAMRASAADLGDAIAVPGSPNDSVPHPWMRADAPEVVRFLRDEGLASGRLHRFGLEESTTVPRATIATAGDISPLAMASTPSALLWVEGSLSAVGEADLRVLADPPSTCEGVTPDTVIHLPTPLAGWDPRTMVATEVDGRTYVALLEQEIRSRDETTLVVFDLGVCRDGG